MPVYSLHLSHTLSSVAYAIVFGLGTLFLFVLLFSQKVASHSCEILRELLAGPFSKPFSPFKALQGYTNVSGVEVES